MSRMLQLSSQWRVESPLIGAALLRSSLRSPPINHDLLSEFRRECAATLDRLLSQSLTGLIAEKLVTLEELMIDGTNEPAPAKAGVRALAGRGSMSRRKRLERIEKAVAERVAELKDELDKDPAEPERRRKQRALQAAEARAPGRAGASEADCAGARAG